MKNNNEEKINISYDRKRYSKPKNLVKKNLVKIYLSDDELKLLEVVQKMDNRKTMSDLCRFHLMKIACSIYSNFPKCDLQHKFVVNTSQILNFLK